MATPKGTQRRAFADIAGKTQRAVGVVALCVLVPSVIFAVVAAGSCTGLGCTSSLAAIAVAVLSFPFALLLIPAIGWLKGKSWAPVVNVVMLVPLFAAGFLAFAILHDIVKTGPPKSPDVGLGLSLTTPDLPVMESTLEYLINERSAARPLVISNRTLDYGHPDDATRWDDCIRDSGMQLGIVKDFRTKAHNSVSLPDGFGMDIGVEVAKSSNVGTGFRYAFTRPGFNSDYSRALIYVEARAQMDGWGMHYLLEVVDSRWTVTRKLCGWIS